MRIEIPNEAESQLRKLAMAAGFGDDMQRYVLHRSLDEDFAEPSSEGAMSSSVMLPRETWKAEFEAFLASVPNRDTRLDDSRESIYRGCGE